MTISLSVKRSVSHCIFQYTRLKSKIAWKEPVKDVVGCTYQLLLLMRNPRVWVH